MRFGTRSFTCSEVSLAFYSFPPRESLEFTSSSRLDYLDELAAVLLDIVIHDSSGKALRPSTSLQRRACRIIEVCRAALAVPKVLRPHVDATTAASAAEILAEAQEQGLENRTLAAVRINQAQTSWWELLDAMETVNQALLDQLQGESAACTWEELVRNSTHREGRRGSARSMANAVDARHRTRSA